MREILFEIRCHARRGHLRSLHGKKARALLGLGQTDLQLTAKKKAGTRSYSSKALSWVTAMGVQKRTRSPLRTHSPVWHLDFSLLRPWSGNPVRLWNDKGVSLHATKFMVICYEVCGPLLHSHRKWIHLCSVQMVCRFWTSTELVLLREMCSHTVDATNYLLEGTSNYKWWQWLLHSSCQTSHFLFCLRVSSHSFISQKGLKFVWILI